MCCTNSKNMFVDKKLDDGTESGAGNVIPSRKLSELAGMGTSTPIIFSRKMADRFHSDRVLMDHILLSHERFCNGDWGDVSNMQFSINSALKSGKGTAGRYTHGSKEPAIIITDNGSEFTVRYEDELEV